MSKNSESEYPSFEMFDVELYEVERKVEKTFRREEVPVRTRRKAHLIEHYIRGFQWVTKSGTYIDAFTGPHDRKNPETWAAKRVLDIKPRWFSNFFLVELDATNIVLIHKMVNAQPPKEKKEKSRSVQVFHGDCNDVIPRLLRENTVTDSAVFCLLDQRHLECKWSTVKALAEFRAEPNHKIELCYFFGSSWFDRSIKSRKDFREVDEWWGGDGWRELAKIPDKHARAKMICDRFKNELGYKYSIPWPIYEGGRLMYFMIHSTDHDRAPGLMFGAYQNATKEVGIQNLFDFFHKIRPKNTKA